MLENAAHREAGQSIQRIEEMYMAAQRSMQKEIEGWYGRFAQNNQISLADARRLLTAGQLEEFRWSVEQYIKVGQNAGTDAAWLKKLENASARVHISRLEAIQLEIQQQLELLFGNQIDEIDDLLKRVTGGGYTRTAYEIQRGLGLGWDMTALDQRKLESLMAKPWTTDGRTFRDRCWTNKNELVHTLHTQMVQGMLRGDSPEKVIQALQKQFGVSRYKARRLVHTETSYFSACSALQTYKDLGIARIEIIETLDSRTCETCGGLDGTVIPLAQYAPGVTVPPFHPNCRGTTAPYYDGMDGERAARNAGGEVYYVPASMPYADWKAIFVDGGGKDGLALAFSSMKGFLRPDGTFDLEKAKEDYRAFLQSVPQENRIYLEQAFEAVEYKQARLRGAAFGYSPKLDAMLYDPENPSFAGFPFVIVNTHELAHRIDATMFFTSWENAAFCRAIEEAKGIVGADPDKFLRYCQNDTQGFLSDVLSAVCESEFAFPWGHSREYWRGKGNKPREIFANLFALEALEGTAHLDFLRENFPRMMEAYQAMWS